VPPRGLPGPGFSLNPDHLTKCAPRYMLFFPWGLHRRARRCSPPDIAGVQVHLAGGDDHDAADAGEGDAAAGFDFSDAACMAAEFAPILGGAPAGQRGQLGRARAHAHVHAHTRTHAHACSHVCSLLLPCLAFCPACLLQTLSGCR
jgi:hypothetical protein